MWRQVHAARVMHTVTEARAWYQLTCQKWHAEERALSYHLDRTAQRAGRRGAFLMSALSWRCYAHPTCSLYQGRIQEFALGGRAPPLSSLLEIGSPLKLGSVGSAVSSYSRVRGGVPAENEFKHSKAVRNPLVAIISSILKCMFYSCHLSGVPWWRRSVAQRGGGQSRLWIRHCVRRNVNNRNAGLVSVNKGHVFQYRCWVVLQLYPHAWSAVGKYSVDIQGR